MPIYQYECNQCNTTIEKIMKLNDPAPVCDSHGEMKKMLTVPAFKFKDGTGTDIGNSMAIPGYPLPPV